MALSPVELIEKTRDFALKLAGSIARQPLVARTVESLRRAAARLAELLAPAWRAAHGWYARREPREKVLLRILGAVLGVFLLYYLLYLPFTSLGAGMGDRIEARQRQLVEVRSMMRSYARLQHDLSEAEKRTARSKDISLFSVIEQTLSKTVGREKISSITPSDHPVPGGYQQFSVDLKLSGLTLGQIVEMLYGVETLPLPVTVANLHVRQREQDTHSYDVDMTCMSLGRNE